MTMFQMITAFWTSQAIGVVARLGVADELARGPRPVDELARAVDASPDALHRVLRMLAMVGVFSETAPRTFALTALGETLRSDVPASMRPMAAFQTMPGHWLPWGRLFDAVRTGESVARIALGEEIYAWYAEHPEEAVFFNAGMSSLSTVAAAELLRVYPFRDGSTIADVGGGHGRLLAAVLRSLPKARGTLLDVREVIETARSEIERAGIADRCNLVAGDFFESVPEGADVHLLKHVVHNWEDEPAVRLLRNCARALTPGGKVVIVEFVLPRDNRPSGAQPMDLNMLVFGGRERSEDDYERILSEAGLRLERVIPTHGPFSVIEAGRAS